MPLHRVLTQFWALPSPLPVGFTCVLFICALVLYHDHSCRKIRFIQLHEPRVVSMQVHSAVAASSAITPGAL